MDYNEIFFRKNLADNIPLSLEGRRLGKDALAAVMLLRVEYGNLVQGFEKDMQEVLKGLKKEGFDDRAAAVAAMEDTDRRARAARQWKEGGTDGEGNPVPRPDMPTEEELAVAEKTRAGLEAFQAERKELEEAWMAARAKKGAQEAPAVKGGLLGRAEYADVCGLLGAEGEMAFTTADGRTVPLGREAFLSMLAANLVG